MDANAILKLKPELTRFGHQFDGYFGRAATRRYLDLYVQGQLSPLPRKSLEPMADAFGVPPRNLQEFLGQFRWDELGGRDELQQYVAHRHAHPQSVGVIERAFEDSKTELGLDHFEVRKFLSIQRHLILSCLSHIFLTEFCLTYRGGNIRA